MRKEVSFVFVSAFIFCLISAVVFAFGSFSMSDSTNQLNPSSGAHVPQGNEKLHSHKPTMGAPVTGVGRDARGRLHRERPHESSPSSKPSVAPTDKTTEQEKEGH